MKKLKYAAIATLAFGVLTFTGCSANGDGLSNNARNAVNGYDGTGYGYSNNYNSTGYGSNYDGTGYGYNSDYNDGLYGNSNYNGYGYNNGGSTTGYGTVYNGTNGMPYTSTTAVVNS